MLLSDEPCYQLANQLLLESQIEINILQLPLSILKYYYEMKKDKVDVMVALSLDSTDSC